MNARRLMVLAFAFALASCALGPEHPRHATPGAIATLGLDGAVTPDIDRHWWTELGDPNLDALMMRALRDAPGVAIASARLDAARAAGDAERSGLLPRLRGGIDEERARLSARSFYPPPYAGGTYWQGDAQLALSWHADLWGRQRDRLAAAEHDVRARRIAVRGARLAIEAALVSAYLELDRAYAVRDLATTATTVRRRLAEIARQRTGAGLASQIDVRRAEAEASEASAELRDARNRIDIAVHQIAALTGQGAGAYPEIGRPNLSHGLTSPLPASLPADLLLRRGDIVIALERVKALGALEHAARAAAYPDLNLRAFAGFSAFGLSELLSAPARTFGGGASLGLPIFDGGRVRAEYHAANAAVDGAIAEYNATVLAAVRDVADQLGTLATVQAQSEDASVRADALDETLRLATQRRDAGLSNDIPVLDATLRELGAQRVLLNLRTTESLARVALVAALGGPALDPQLPSPTPPAGAP